MTATEPVTDVGQKHYNIIHFLPKYSCEIKVLKLKELWIIVDSSVVPFFAHINILPVFSCPYSSGYLG